MSLVRVASAFSQQSDELAIGSAGTIPKWLYALQLVVISFVIMAPAFSLQNARQAGGDEAGKLSLLDKLETPNRIRQLAYTVSVLSFGISGAYFFLNHAASRVASPLLFALMLASYAVVVTSLVWSDSRSESFRSVVTVALVGFGAIGLGTIWKARDFVVMVLALSAFMLVIGVLAELRVGTFLGGESYRFSGLLHPNKQASSLAMFVVAAVVVWIAERRKLLLLAAIAALGMLVLTGSRGGLLTCFAGLGVVVWLRLSGAARLRFCLTAMFGLGLLITLFAVTPSLNEAVMEVARLGRQEAGADPTKLTGRLPIWADVISYIEDRPVLGYGYSGFWTTERIYRMSFIHKWEFSNAHSSYFDTLLSVGVVGFTLGFLTLLMAIARGWRWYGHSSDIGVNFTVAVIVMGLVNSLTESIFYGAGYEPLCVMVAVSLIVFHPLTKTGEDENE
ncbi:MAG: Wzy-type polysaccharide biosynthesis protein UppW [Aureliella sp.]